tara:strand:- start:2286 stop:3203 length:918 start_codon:yes stop_codon:yes gene_type:complete
MYGLEECYFLGVICARGTFNYNDNQIQIFIPYKKSVLKGKKKDHDHSARLLFGLNEIANRFKKRLGTVTEIIPGSATKSSGVHSLIIKLETSTIMWDMLYKPFDKQETYKSMQVPEMFFDKKKTNQDQVKEFIKGYSDIAGTIRSSNNDQNGIHRVYIDVMNNKDNWAVPAQLCSLFQQRLDVPVREIMYGHPNLNRKFREHQIRIDAVSFSKKIGFNFSHKQDVLLELANENIKTGIRPIKICPGLKGKPKTRKKKPKHPEEKNSEKLPAKLVGKHFNRFAEICSSCGCIQDQKIKLKERPELK